MDKPIPEHTDILGGPIRLGTVLAISTVNMLKICVVTKINPKMIRVMPVLGGSRKDKGYLVYPNQTITVSEEDAVVYKLKNLKT